MSPLLRRLPSGLWALLAAPTVQHVDPRPVRVVPEDLVETPALVRLRPVRAEVAA